MKRSCTGISSPILIAVSLLLGGAVLLDARPACAQSDVQLWTSAGVRYRPARPIRLTLTQNLRFDENMSRASVIAPDFSFSYDPAKWLRLSAGYRLYYERDNAGDFGTSHRLHQDARIRTDLDLLRLSYRLRMQETFEGADTRLTVRNRVGIALDTDSIVTPEISTEAFTRLNGKNASILRKWRLTAGVALDLDPVEVGVYYRLEIPVDDGNDPVLHIIGLDVQFGFSSYSRGGSDAEEPAGPAELTEPPAAE